MDGAIAVADPSDRRLHGTINDCAGGVTPWGTDVMAEENIHAEETDRPRPLQA